jgi:hypothetical protein
MKAPRLVLISALLSSAVARPARADEGTWVATRLENEVVKPLAEREAQPPRFARIMNVPMERKVRVASSGPWRDSRGNAYLTFSVDARPLGSSLPWRENSLTGCIYLDTGAIYVRSGPRYRPAAFLRGLATWSECILPAALASLAACQYTWETARL